MHRIIIDLLYALMNKLLIKIVLLIFFATVNIVAAPKVTMNVLIDSKFANVCQKESFKYKGIFTSKEKFSNNNISTDWYLYFRIRNEVNSELRYGSLIKLKANTSRSKREIYDKYYKPSIAEQVMLYLESGYGRVEIGNYTGVTESMKVNAGTFASATGGIDGNSQYYWNQFTADIITNKTKDTKYAFLKTANLTRNKLGKFAFRGVNAVKVNYYTPEFYGLRFGFTFTPKAKVHSTALNVNKRVKGKDIFKNMFEISLYYTDEIGNIGVKLAIVSEFGKNKKDKEKNLMAYEVGTNLSYQGFIVGASYRDCRKYGACNRNNTLEFGEESYWTAGIGYANSPISASLTHLQAKRGIGIVNDGNNNKYNKLKNTVIGVDYRIARDLMPYIEFSSFKMNQASRFKKEDNNNGYIFMIGVKMNL